MLMCYTYNHQMHAYACVNADIHVGPRQVNIRNNGILKEHAKM